MTGGATASVRREERGARGAEAEGAELGLERSGPRGEGVAGPTWGGGLGCCALRFGARRERVRVGPRKRK